MIPLIIANWKANPVTLSDARKLASDVEVSLGGIRGCEVVIAPPYPFLVDVGKVLARAALGAQDVFWDAGPCTGEVSADSLKSMGVRYTLIGHSERRIYAGETDEMVNRKVNAALSRKITPVLCIGERDRVDGEISQVVGNQLEAAMRGVPRGSAAKVVIAYEPVWAISTMPNAKPDTPDNAFRVMIYIRRLLSDLYGRKLAEKIRVIYGGSVKEANARAFLREGKMGGLLVGGASLSAQSFASVIREAVRR